MDIVKNEITILRRKRPKNVDLMLRMNLIHGTIYKEIKFVTLEIS